MKQPDAPPQGWPVLGAAEASPSTKYIMLKIATWNLCLGLKNKIDTVYGCLTEENIVIAMLQEVDIKKEYPLNYWQQKTIN